MLSRGAAAWAAVGSAEARAVSAFRDESRGTGYACRCERTETDARRTQVAVRCIQIRNIFVSISIREIKRRMR